VIANSLSSYDTVLHHSPTGTTGNATRWFASSSGVSMRALWCAVCSLAVGLSACQGGRLPPAPSTESATSPYLIGPGDTLTIFVWRNPELSTDVTVRPDGRVSM